MKQVIRTDRLRVGGPYSVAWRAGDFLFVSGRGPFDPSSGMVAGDTIEIQTRQTLANVEAALEAAGASLRDVVKVTGHTYGCIALFAHE